MAKGAVDREKSPTHSAYVFVSSDSLQRELQLGGPYRLTQPAAVPTTRCMPGLSYESSGVDYDKLDAFKRACQQAAATTTDALRLHGLSEPAGVRGESAYLMETPGSFLAHVEEGLGTK